MSLEAEFEERLSLATQAVDIARRTDDKAALVDAVRLSHESITMPQRGATSFGTTA